MNQLQIIKEVLDKFDRNEVDYCILRNYEGLISNNYLDKDIDILVSKKSYSQAARILRAEKFTLNKKISLGTQKLYCKYINGEFFIFDLKVGNLAYMDLPYLHGEGILRRKVKKSFFFVPNKEDFFYSLLLHSIIDKSRFKQEYVSSLNKLLDNGIAMNYSAIDKIKLVTPRMMDMISKRDYKTLEKMRNKLIFKLLVQPKNWLPITKVVYKAKIKKVFKVINPFYYAPLMTFVGTDGSGKSTMTKKIKTALKESGVKVKYVYMGWNNHILPVGLFSKVFHLILGKKKKEKEVLNEEVNEGKNNTECSNQILFSNPKKKKGILNKTICFSADLFVITEMYLRYLFRILPYQKLGYVVLSDRYAYDRALHPVTSKIARKFILNFYPKPKMVFYLHNDALILYNRKKEIPVDEIKRQQEVFAKLKKKLGLIKIKTTNPDKDTEEVLNRYVLKETFSN
jgi:thymidylate kinase